MSLKHLDISRTTKILVDFIPGKSEEERGLEILLGVQMAVG